MQRTLVFYIDSKTVYISLYTPLVPHIFWPVTPFEHHQCLVTTETDICQIYLCATFYLNMIYDSWKWKTVKEKCENNDCLKYILSVFYFILSITCQATPCGVMTPPFKNTGVLYSLRKCCKLLTHVSPSCSGLFLSWCSRVRSLHGWTRRDSPVAQLSLQLRQQPRVHLQHHHWKGQRDRAETRELPAARWRLPEGGCERRKQRVPAPVHKV